MIKLLCIGYVSLAASYQLQANEQLSDNLVWNFIFYTGYFFVPLIIRAMLTKKLDKSDIFWLQYFLIIFTSNQMYYELCIISTKKWVYSNNFYFGIFVVITLLFFIIKFIINRREQ